MSFFGDRLREARELVRLLPWMLRLLWAGQKAAALGLTALTLVQAAVPVAQLWVTKLIIDQLVRVIALPAGERAGEPVQLVFQYLALEAAVLLGGVLIGLAAGHARNVLQEWLVYRLQLRVLEQSSRVDLEAYESPLYHDQLARAQQQVDDGPVRLLGALLEVAQSGLTLVSIGALVVAYDPLLALLLAVTVLPSFWATLHYGWKRFVVFDSRTPDGRRAQYLSAVLNAGVAAKEVRVWGLTSYLMRHVRELRQRFRQENIALSRGQSLATLGGEVLSTLGYFGAYLMVILAVVAGRLTLGDAVLYAGAFTRLQQLVDRLLTAVANAYEVQLFARNLRDFLAIEPRVVAPANPRPAPPLVRGVEVRDLSFTYPGTDRQVLDRISFEITPGECVAVVGANGSGKTTLVKLLLRLYDPTAGAVLADGVDLRQLDPDEWRSRTGVVFQDYGRFQLTARENIGFGWVPDIDDLEKIRRAAREAGIDDVLAGLPQGYETMLGRQFTGGEELSLGQWQRVALARALLRGAPFLIMDEPTAAMDARAEYELYRYLEQLAGGRMTLLISHRFSTVRIADRIIVIDDGRIIEEGTHAALLSRDTLYASLFRLQAEGYQLDGKLDGQLDGPLDGGAGAAAEPDGVVVRAGG